MDSPLNRSRLLAYLALLAAPLFFSTNVIFGKALADVAPFTLAFLRWTGSSMILALICRKQLVALYPFIKQQWRLLMILGFLGMFVSGGIVYLALHKTSATNGTLIYTMSPVIIIAIETLWRNRPLKLREGIGIALAIAGVVFIVAKGSWQVLLSLKFNPGDLLFVIAAFGWATYSVLLRSKVLAEINTITLLAIIAIAGAMLLAPFATIELMTNQIMPTTQKHWLMISGLIGLSSLAAFSSFQYGIKILGSSTAGIFMYLLPAFGIAMAWIFLSETIKPFHLTGSVLILTGVILATFPLVRKKH